MTFASARSRSFNAIAGGEPVILLRRGQVRANALKWNDIPESDLDETIRKAGLSTHEQVDLAVLETDGEISVVATPKSTEEPD